MLNSPATCIATLNESQCAVKFADGGAAILTSPNLNSALWKDSKARLSFSSPEYSRITTLSDLDPYYLRSLVEFMRLQSRIREEMENVVEEHLKKWRNLVTVKSSHQMWKAIAVGDVSFELPVPKATSKEEVDTQKEAIAKMFPQMSRAALESLAQKRLKYVPPEWHFCIWLKGNWGDGHERRILFQSDAEPKLGLEG